MDRPKEERDLLIKASSLEYGLAPTVAILLSYCNLAQALRKDANCSSVAKKWMVSSRGPGDPRHGHDWSPQRGWRQREDQ